MTKSPSPTVIGRAFGEENRKRLLARYFEMSGEVSVSNAWKHVYRLLLWIDTTTGLVHCYESDKAQPGRPWYERSLRAHGFIAEQLGVTPTGLIREIDWLFRKALENLVEFSRKWPTELAAQQRAEYGGQRFPEPGHDPDLVDIILSVLSPWFREVPSEDCLRRLSQEIYQHLRAENKRKNLVGEGFEDVLAAVVERLPKARNLDLTTRSALHEIPGFYEPPDGEKRRKVDLALVRHDGRQRSLLTVKWSIRADREEQFVSDFRTYGRLERSNKPFDYVLVTNEFDPARLVAACEKQIDGRFLFTSVIHVNPQVPLVAYGPEPKRSAQRVVELVRRRRLLSLEDWLRGLETVGQSKSGREISDEIGASNPVGVGNRLAPRTQPRTGAGPVRLATLLGAIVRGRSVSSEGKNGRVCEGCGLPIAHFAPVGQDQAIDSSAHLCI